MSDEELNALVKQAMDRAIERLQKLHSHAGRPAWDQVICEELSKPFTTLRAQLAEANARADRAEAALATVFGDGLRTAISVIASIGYGKNEDADAGHEEALRAVEKYLTDWTNRSQPHDSTALERHDAKTREKTLREAAQASSRYNVNRGQGSATARAITTAILALIEAPNAR